MPTLLAVWRGHHSAAPLRVGRYLVVWLLAGLAAFAVADGEVMRQHQRCKRDTAEASQPDKKFVSYILHVLRCPS